MNSPTLTVGELITLLEKYPKDSPVWSEGCDCWGDVRSVVQMSAWDPSKSEEHPRLSNTGVTMDHVLLLR